MYLQDFFLENPEDTGSSSSPLTTKGDIWGYSTSDGRFPVGTNGHIIVADSTQPFGIKWAAISGGGDMLQATYDPAGIGEQLLGLTATQTLTNKTFDLTDNTLTGTKAEFDTACSDGNFLYVGDITQYTDEDAQDAVGAMVDSSLTYTDATPELKVTNPVASQTGNSGLFLTTNGTTTSWGNPYILPPIDDFYDPTGGLPAGPSVGDRYISEATANGWTEDYIYEWDGSSWIETIPEEGFMIWDLLELIFYVFFSGGWMEEGSEAFLELDGSNANSNINISTYDLITTGATGRDSDNEINWGTDDSLAIVIGGVTHNIVSISDGAGDNDKLATQGYVDDAIIPDTDAKVGVDAVATPDYLGIAGSDGALRVDATLDYADGGDFVTLGLDATLKSNYDAGYSHISADGSSHSFIDQSVVSGSSPTFDQITLSSTPTNGTDGATKDYVDGLIQGLDWQESVIDRFDPTSALPTTPSAGDRYISTATANGWTADYIYEYNGATWDETAPSEGMATWVEDEDVLYVFNTSWVKFGTTVTHNNTTGKQGGTSDQYYHLTTAQHTIATQEASTSLSGYLSSTDWNTFNSKAPTTSPTFATSITGSYLTASEILITNGSKEIVSAPVATYPSLTELSYIKGLTSDIQTQLNAKGVGDMLLDTAQVVTELKTFVKDKIALKGASTGVTTLSTINGSANNFIATFPAKTGTVAMTSDITGTNSGTNTGDDALNSTSLQLDQTSAQTITNDSPIFDVLTASELVATDASKKLQSLAVATYPSLTEISYVKGVTSSIQTQLNDTLSNPMTTGGDVIYGGISGTPTRLANGTAGKVLQSNGTTLAPTWETAGAGDVIKVGTPLDNQVGVWTGDGTIEGTTGLTYDGANFQLTGDIGSTATRITKGWFTDIESTNIPTVGGTAILTSLTAPQFTTVELGHATDTTLSRSAAGVLAVEGVVIPSISSTNVLTNKAITKRVVTTTNDATAVIDVTITDDYELTAMSADTAFSLSGTATDGQQIILRFKDDGTTRALTFTGITAIGVTLPTTTTVSKWHYVGIKYNLSATAWHAIAYAVEA